MTRGRLWRSILAAVLFAAMAAGAQKGELDIPLTLQLHKESDERFRPSGWAGMAWSDRKPEGDWKLPELTSPSPLYARKELGGIDRLFVLDVSKAKASMFDLLHFDANGNGDLTDDAVLKGKVNRNSDDYWSVEFPPVEIRLEPGARRYAFNASLYAYRSEGRQTSAAFPGISINANLRTLCSYSGSFSLGGKTYRVALSDNLLNGRFSDPLKIRSDRYSDGRLSFEGDVLYLAGGREPSYTDGMTLAGRLHLGDTLYDVELDDRHTRLRLTPVAAPRHPLALAAAPSRLLLEDVDGGPSVYVYEGTSLLRLAEGRYRAIGYQLEQKARDGSSWRLYASATRSAATVLVGAEEKAELLFGEPYRVTVNVPEWSLRGALSSPAKDIRLEFSVVGRDQEIVGDLACVSGRSKDVPMSSKYSQRPKEAAYTVARQDGEMVDRGVFEYG